MAVRAGLSAMLQRPSALGDSADDLLEVCYQAGTLKELETLIPLLDIVILTADGASGPELRRVLAQEEGELALLLLVDDFQATRLISGLPLRAWGILPLDVSAEELLAAVRALHQGLLVGTPALLGPAIPRFLAAENDDPEPIIDALTERESQVLQLLARGLANKQIAASLGISEHTAKFHLSSIYNKLGVTNRAEAVRIGIQNGLILL
jgi:DNA-binding NarL/FixJ family response regulator